MEVKDVQVAGVPLEDFKLWEAIHDLMDRVTELENYVHKSRE